MGIVQARIGIIIIFHKFLRAFVLVGLLVGACSTNPAVPAGPITIVATTSVVADLVENVVGDRAQVELLMPLGADPHEFQLTAKQGAQLREADLVVAIGLGLEATVMDTLDAAAGDGVPVVQLGPLLNPRNFPDGQPDPHVWMDPLRMADAALLVADALAAQDGTVDWKMSAQSYADQLIETDRTITSLMAGLRTDRRVMVTNHDAFGYFADRYGLEIVGVIIPGGSTLANPSSAELADLVKLIDDLGVPALFVETTESDRLAMAIASETNSPISVVNLLGASLAPAGEPGDTLISLLLVDAERIVAGLGDGQEQTP